MLQGVIRLAKAAGVEVAGSVNDPGLMPVPPVRIHRVASRRGSSHAPPVGAIPNMDPSWLESWGRWQESCWATPIRIKDGECLTALGTLQSSSVSWHRAAEE